MGELQSIHHSAIIHQLLSHSLFFSLALFIYQTLQFKREAVDPEQHLACTDSNLLTWTHDEKTSKQQRISFLSIMSLSSSEMWLFFMQKELWQRACVCLCVCSSVCVGLTGHRLEVALQATPSLSNSQSVTAVLLYHFLRLCLPHTHFFCLLSQFFSLSLPHFCLWEPHSGTKDWTNRLSELMWINSYFLWLPVPFTTAEV